MDRERCKACGMPKPPLAMEQDDDFCSTDCARRHYSQSREDQMFPASRPLRRPDPASARKRSFLAKSAANGSRTFFNS
jgi:hypothetical protein